MNRDPGIREAAGADWTLIVDELRGMGHYVYVLPTDIIDKSSFFAAVRATMPLNPPVMHEEWNALSGSLFEGLLSSEHHRIAIVWPSSTMMAKEARKDFENARGVLADVAEDLNDVEATEGQPKTLAVVLT
jgi:hypothetical protein